MTQQQSIYCPNSIFDNGVISIGEFKTMNDCMNYPIKDWCITREEDNKFDAYKRQGDRLLIVCSWNRTDSQRFVVAIASRNHKIKYFDLNDLPMDLIAKTYEQSLGNDAISILKQYGITNESKTNKNMKKNTIKLNESQLRKIVTESVKKVLKESLNTSKITEQAMQLLDTYGSFGEESSEQFMEDAMNVLYNFKAKAASIITKINSIANQYSNMDDDIEEPIANILSDIANI